MKFTSTSAFAFVRALPLAAAFPAHMLSAIKNSPNVEIERRAADVMALAQRQAGADAATALFEAIPTFDAAGQFINVGPGSGHEWQPPGPNDLRGPCPGLNAFANHGFLPRSGYATIAQFIEATTSVVGMGVDLAAFLSLLGALIDSGDLLGWSIGGTPPAGVGGLLAQGGNGLIGSHNKYENDVSPTRPDLYQVGNNYITQASQFQELIDVSPGGVVTLDSLTTHRSNRFDSSIANNPYFFNAPFPGLLVQSAAFTFIYRFMANHSAEDPIGTLTHDTIKTWFAISGENGNYLATQGHERIPDNWYRRSLTSTYTIPYFLADTLVAAGLHDKFLSVGGNLNGQTNHFAGVDVANLTGGVFNSADLLQGNNLGCFAYQTVAQLKTDFLVDDVLNQVQSAVADVVTELGCPQLREFDEALLEQFPGYQKAPVYGKMI